MSLVPSASPHTPPPVLQVRVLYLRDAAAVYTDEAGVLGPAYATAGSVGLDLRACPPLPENGEHEMAIAPGERLAVPSGIAVEPLDPGFAGFVYSRSGLGAVRGLVVAQGTGVIDPDYRGEITVYLLNTSQETRRIRRGERIAQLVFQPALRVELKPAAGLGDTGRGTGGFGHTGDI